MKVKTWLTAWLLSFGIGFGTVSALVTTFSLPGISLTGLGFYCALLCGLCAWIFHIRSGHWILLGSLGTILGYSLIFGDLWRSLLSLAYHLSVLFDSAYGWGTLNVPILTQYSSQLSAVLTLALLPILLICRAVCRQKRLILCLPLALIPLYPCFVLTDKVPDGWCFLLILAAVLALVLTQDSRRRSHTDGNRMTALALIPAVLLSVFLVNTVPQEGYWKQLSSLQALSQYLPSLEQQLDNVEPAPGMPANDRTNLSYIGPQNKTDLPVMEVRAGYGGFLYLRYQSFDSYSGSLWLASEKQEEPSFWPVENDLDPLGAVSITTKQPFDGMFIPYYSRSGSYLQLESGKLPNTEILSQYRISVGQLRDTYSSSTPLDLSSWLELPSYTREAAERILREHNLQTPEQITKYVQNCAEYSLDTERMPLGTRDFAIWFLEKSETGYCVHFATAAAVLLRAAGYPARYVTGYAVMTKRGIPTTVTQDMAHAWVEYQDPSEGPFWRILEATPGIAPEDPTVEPTTEPSQSTEPSQEPTQTVPPSIAPTLPDNTNPSGSVTEPVTKPTEAPSPQEDPTVDLSPLWTALGYVGLLAAAILLLWAQYSIRLRLRRKQQRTGSRNDQALARWQEIRRLSRLLKAAPPESLLELAEKARFSQHTLTKEELSALGQYLQKQRKAIENLPCWKRLFLKLIWAI